MKKINNTMMGFALILAFTSFSFAEWETQDVGFPEDIQVAAMSVVNDSIVWGVGGSALTDPFFQGISRTTDGGETWDYSTITVPGFDLAEYITVHVFALSDSLAWVVLAYDIALPHKGLIVKTVDGGASWEAQTSAYPNTPGLHNGPDFVHFFDENNGVTAGDLEEIYTTSDGGDHWTQVPASNYPAILDNEDPYNASYCTMGDSSLAFGTNSGRVFRTSDRGITWTVADVGLGQTYIWTSFQDEMIGLATAPIAGRAIAKTMDGGVTWTTLPNELPTNAILIHQKGTLSSYMYGSAAMPLYLGSNPGTGFTSDFGNSWYDQDNISRLPTIWSDSTTGWSGGLDNLIHKWEDPAHVSIAENQSVVPVSMKLSQNLPNPFNPSTTIRFDLDTPGHVNLEVFNIRGSKIASLANAHHSAGFHEVAFDASHLASGTYIYRLSTKAGSMSRKMLLIK